MVIHQPKLCKDAYLSLCFFFQNNDRFYLSTAYLGVLINILHAESLVFS